MIGIRKFVVGTGAAGMLAAGALLLFGQVGVAATRSFDSSSSPAQVTIATPSAACTGAIQAIKAAVVADRAEDASERHLAKTGDEDSPADPADAAEDATEHANFKSLFSAARTACAPAETAVTTSTRSPQCTAAIQALKAAFAQGRPTTKAQWQQMQTLFANVRTACGFASWSWDRR